MKKALKYFAIVFGIIVGLVILFFLYINIPVKTPSTPFDLGVTYSWRYSDELSVDWQDVYTAMLDDLDVKKVRIPVYWDHIEAVEGQYNWDHLDYEVAEAEKRNAQLILVIGRKVPRWPECFIPQWGLEDTDKRQERLLIFIEEVINRYKDSSAVAIWQIENEPFLGYGNCPPFDVDFFDQEIAKARATDPSRPILITDSGELSLWVPAAKRADIFGTTMYRNVYTQEYGYYEYPVGPRFFQLKRWMIDVFADQKNAIVIELQGEPWMAGTTADFPKEQQLEHMNPEQLVENVNFARQGGFDDIYLWGVEWWYYMKEVHGEDATWEAARGMFATANQD